VVVSKRQFFGNLKIQSVDITVFVRASNTGKSTYWTASFRKKIQNKKLARKIIVSFASFSILGTY